MGLGALHEALALDAAGADGDHALDDVEPLAERVGGGVEQGAHAVLLVVAHHRPLHFRLADAIRRDHDRADRDRADQQHRQDEAP